MEQSNSRLDDLIQSTLIQHTLFQGNNLKD
jgi:hypothetical protein